MPHPARRVGAVLGLALAAFIAGGCAESEAPTSISAVNGGPFNSGTYEEEVFGDLYIGGSKITGGAYEAVLQKVDEDGDPAGVEMFMQVNPAGWDSGWMYGWYDVSANDGPCNPNSEDHSEVHTTGEDEEWHCIAAGNSYRFTLYRGSSESGTVLKTFIIDYPIYLATAVSNSNAGHNERIQAYGTGVGYGYNDIYVSVDTLPNGSHSDTPVLWIDNAGTSIGSGDNFTNQTSPAGTKEDYFQFSFVGTTFATNISDSIAAQPLAKLWIYKGTSAPVLVHETGWASYRNMQATPWEGLQRTIRFADLCQTAGTYQVALDIMRPNEAVPTVPSSNAAWRMITINSSTPALPSGCPQPPAPMTLALSGTSSMRPYMTCPMTGSLSGGVAPYTWTWSVTGKGGSIVQNSYPNLADVTIRNNDIIVTATVQDGSGNSVQASYPITSNSSVPDVCV